MEDYEISLEVPKGVNLVLKGDDDDYRIENVDGSITLDIDDGDAELRNCNGNHFDFNVDDGDIEMRGGNGFLYVRSDDGDIIIRDGNFTGGRTSSRNRPGTARPATHPYRDSRK